MILWVVFWLKQSEQLLKQQKICLIKKKKNFSFFLTGCVWHYHWCLHNAIALCLC